MTQGGEKDGGNEEMGTDTRYKQLLESLEECKEAGTVEVEDWDKVENLGEIPKKEVYKLSGQSANKLLSFYISIVAEFETLCTLIIHTEVFDFGMKREGSYEFLSESFTQKNKEDMLFYLGIIDEGLKGEMSRVRKRRNELAHTDQHHEVENIDNIKSDVKRAKKARDKLGAIDKKIESNAFRQPDKY